VIESSFKKCQVLILGAGLDTSFESHLSKTFQHISVTVFQTFVVDVESVINERRKLRPVNITNSIDISADLRQYDDLRKKLIFSGFIF